MGRAPFARADVECATEARYRGLVNRARERAWRYTRGRRKLARSHGARIRRGSHGQFRRRAAEIQL